VNNSFFLIEPFLSLRKALVRVFAYLDFLMGRPHRIKIAMKSFPMELPSSKQLLPFLSREACLSFAEGQDFCPPLFSRELLMAPFRVAFYFFHACRRSKNVFPIFLAISHESPPSLKIFPPPRASTSLCGARSGYRRHSRSLSVS